ncbi:MAG: porin [Burkholderiaceae bacterium]
MMKKIVLVAALAAIAAPAFAQSSVTLYGRINTTVENKKIGNADRITTVDNNASRFGLKGIEDLGGGLKASFVLESGFASDTGVAANPFWGRESQVTLSGNFGAVRLGNWFPGSYYASADYVSMHNHDTGDSADAFFGGAFIQKNKVAYFTPNVEGFNAEVAVAAGEGTLPRGYDVAGNYDMGDLHLGAGYSKQGDVNAYEGRALYTMGAFTFGGYIQRENNDANKANKSRNIGRLAVMYVLGASEFHLNYGGTQSGGTFGNTGAQQYTLAYNYNLSKRTKVYGYYTAVDNKAPNKFGDFSALAMGIRHNF